MPPAVARVQRALCCAGRSGARYPPGMLRHGASTPHSIGMAANRPLRAGRRAGCGSGLWRGRAAAAERVRDTWTHATGACGRCHGRRRLGSHRNRSAEPGAHGSTRPRGPRVRDAGPRAFTSWHETRPRASRAHGDRAAGSRACGSRRAGHGTAFLSSPIDSVGQSRPADSSRRRGACTSMISERGSTGPLSTTGGTIPRNLVHICPPSIDETCGSYFRRFRQERLLSLRIRVPGLLRRARHPLVGAGGRYESRRLEQHARLAREPRRAGRDHPLRASTHPERRGLTGRSEGRDHARRARHAARRRRGLRRRAAERRERPPRTGGAAGRRAGLDTPHAGRMERERGGDQHRRQQLVRRVPHPSGASSRRSPSSRSTAMSTCFPTGGPCRATFATPFAPARSTRASRRASM